MIESILLSAVPISTFKGEKRLTHASGFLFEREDRLFLVTSRHVMIDKASEHFPDLVTIEVHTDADNIAKTAGFSIPLYREGKSSWQQGKDSAGEVDVAVIEIDRSALPETAVFHCFTPDHLVSTDTAVEIGTSVLVVGFPLGFHDGLHRIPVVRQAVVASSFGLRFQGEGYFLTDARTHRGSSGAPVVMRIEDPESELEALPWLLLGVHSARLDMGSREADEDEALGLNCVWYADILMTLTRD